MLFNTMQYLLFFLTVVLVYYILPHKIRYIWLLGASYYFYMQWNAAYILLMFSSTAVTWLGAIAIDKADKIYKENTEKCHKYKKIAVVTGLAINLALLGYFKYFEFVLDSINSVITYAGGNAIEVAYKVVLPVGISFYILQALGYLIDVYRGSVEVEKNFLRYALFVSFFPQLVAGPIERTKNLMHQLKAEHKFDYENIRKGVLWILYGLMLKMVIADRAAIMVDTVYNDTNIYHGFYIVIAMVLFCIQIYCDFYGYSVIAKGSALLLGINLMSNFEAPYFSRSIKEFWRRWHVSLSTWFRDYLYIPLGGNRKGDFCKRRNLMTVFAVSGLWHGANWTFLIWGVLHGAYQIIEDVLRPAKKAGAESEVTDGKVTDAVKKDSAIKVFFQTVFTFALVAFAFLFFRVEGIYEAYLAVKNLLRLDNFYIFLKPDMLYLGVPMKEVLALGLAILALFVVDYFRYKGKDVTEFVLKQRFVIRYVVYAALFFMVVLYGCYGETYNAQNFIYFQF